MFFNTSFLAYYLNYLFVATIFYKSLVDGFRRYSRPWAQFFLLLTSHPVNNIYSLSINHDVISHLIFIFNIFFKHKYLQN